MATQKQRKMRDLPENSPRVKAAKVRYANDPSAGTLAADLAKKKGQGNFRWKKQ